MLYLLSYFLPNNLRALPLTITIFTELSLVLISSAELMTVNLQLTPNKCQCSVCKARRTSVSTLCVCVGTGQCRVGGGVSPASCLHTGIRQVFVWLIAHTSQQACHAKGYAGKASSSRTTRLSLVLSESIDCFVLCAALPFVGGQNIGAVLVPSP